MRRPRLQLSIITLVILSTLLQYVSSAPVAQSDGTSWEHEGDPPGKLTCVSDRSSDYYGLGVRLGIYMSWMTGYIANISVPDEIAGALDQNAIFMFALAIAMVRCTITDLLSRMDGIILMHLSGGTLFSCMSIWGYRTVLYANDGPKAISNFGGFGTHLRLLLCMAVSVYGFWFWFFGLVNNLPKPSEMTLESQDDKNPLACDNVQTFFFSRLDANGGIRIYYIFTCIGCMVYFGIMTLVSVIGPTTRLCKMTFLVRYKFFRTSSRLKYATGFNYKQLRYIFYVLRIGNLFWIIFSIVTVEMTLQYNHIESVLGSNGRIFFPSQLLPTVIGACSLCRIIYLRFEKWRAPKDSKPSLSKRQTAPKRASTIPRGRGWLRVFAPAVPRASPSPNEQDELHDHDMDKDIKDQPTWWRYLVAYLPWLNAVHIWFKAEMVAVEDEIDHHEGKDQNDVESASSDSKNSTHKLEARNTWGTHATSDG